MRQGTADTQMQDWMARYGARALKVMFPDGTPPAGFQARQIPSSTFCTVVKVSAGDRAAAIKAFGADAGPAFDRELAMLALLGPHGMCPRLLGYSKADRVIVMDWVAGETLASALTPGTLASLAERAGAWFARFTGLTRREPADTDWHSYLGRYGELAGNGALDAEADALRRLPIRSHAIAKNDGFLANFILRPDGALTGLDFESASLKPVGWDILLTARALRRAFPDRADTAIDGLLAGWSAATDEAGDFARLTRFFARETAHLEPGGPEHG